MGGQDRSAATSPTQPSDLSQKRRPSYSSPDTIVISRQPGQDSAARGTINSGLSPSGSANVGSVPTPAHLASALQAARLDSAIQEDRRAAPVADNKIIIHDLLARNPTLRDSGFAVWCDVRSNSSTNLAAINSQASAPTAGSNLTDQHSGERPLFTTNAPPINGRTGSTGSVGNYPPLQPPGQPGQPGGVPRERERSRSGAATPREMVWVDSKEGLSDMATNIRGISNALSNVAIALSVKSVVVITKLSDATLPELAHEMVDWLLRRDTTDTRIEVSVEDELMSRSSFNVESLRKTEKDTGNSLVSWSVEKLQQNPGKYDMVITLGGDGTVLYTSWLFQKMVPPVLSFGLGSLGFMTENNFENFREILADHLENGISCALRMRFECTVMRSKNANGSGDMSELRREIESAGLSGNFETHNKGETFVILNDVVVDRGPNAFITMTELYGNYELLTSIHADGVVISTPSGSTAYSMSAGGSLVHPDVPATLVSPICPHTLSFRPLVLPDSMILHVGVPYDARSSAYASFDGRERVELRRGDFLAISASRYPFPKVLGLNFTSVNWVQQLSQTLHWNEQKRPKRFTE